MSMSIESGSIEKGNGKQNSGTAKRARGLDRAQSHGCGLREKPPDTYNEG